MLITSSGPRPRPHKVPIGLRVVVVVSGLLGGEGGRRLVAEVLALPVRPPPSSAAAPVPGHVFVQDARQTDGDHEKMSIGLWKNCPTK